MVVHVSATVAAEKEFVLCAPRAPASWCTTGGTYDAAMCVTIASVADRSVLVRQNGPDVKTQRMLVPYGNAQAAQDYREDATWRVLEADESGHFDEHEWVFDS